MILLFQTFIENFQHLFYVPDQFLGNNDILINFRWINIYLEDLRILRERLCISRHTVAEPGPNDYKKVTLADPVVGRLCAVHSQHPRIPGICSGERAFSH